ncbi:MAG: protein-tyrosine phosphatase family protein [Bellilinea sp.]
MKTYIPDQLYQSPRPNPGSHQPSIGDVENWIEAAKMVGIRTIICLLTDNQLEYYSHLPNGLLDIYRESGFNVIHRPITDPVYDSMGWQELAENLPRIYQDYLAADKPVLIHCSAGVDRSPKAAEYIVSQINKP